MLLKQTRKEVIMGLVILTQHHLAKIEVFTRKQ
jgi:hypothetical protein